jgi:hypothetical protein
MSDLKVLQAGPPLQLRQETVPAPELGGAVIVRGLMASEGFAVDGLRQQALKRVHQAAAAHRRRVAALADGAPAPEFDQPELEFDELRAYGAYVPHLLACAVVTPSGLGLYTAEQWELVGQHHPGLVNRLQAVAEKLSGLDVEDVEKN